MIGTIICSVVVFLCGLFIGFEFGCCYLAQAFKKLILAALEDDIKNNLKEEYQTPYNKEVTEKKIQAYNYLKTLWS